MATDPEWGDAFLAQTRADFAAADAVATSGLAPSSLAMLLQMVFEKLAKAALLRMRSADLEDVTSTHATAGRLLKILRRERRRFDSLGGAHAWGDVIWMIEELERAHPQIARSKTDAKLEYPWETPAGAIQWPERDLPVARRLGDPRSNLKTRVTRFADQLAWQFTNCFRERAADGPFQYFSARSETPNIGRT
jgi:hypothetical protein